MPGAQPLRAVDLAHLGLVICALLKRRESRRAADHRLVALLQLVSAGLLAAQMQGLLASVLQLLTVISALASLLAHELGVSVRCQPCCGAVFSCWWRPCRWPWCCFCSCRGSLRYGPRISAPAAVRSLVCLRRWIPSPSASSSAVMPPQPG